MNAYQPIFSPASKPLTLTLFNANEGLAKYAGIRIFEGIVTGQEFVEHFAIEASSELYPEFLKRQRDLEKTRANKLIQYFDERTDNVLPSVVIFISRLEDEQAVQVGNRMMTIATLPSGADRLIADGQNRHNLYSTVISTQPWRSNETLSVKFICVDSGDSLEEHGQIIRQLFSDYHYNLKKPSTALNLYFDNSQPYRKFLDRFLVLEVHGQPLKNFISTTGKATPSSLMLFNQLLDFISTAIGKTSAAINKLLKDKPECGEQLFERYSPVVQSFFNICPLDLLGVLNKDDTMFEKFIFAKAFAWTARSLVEETIDEYMFEREEEGQKINPAQIALDFSPLQAIEKLPLQDMKDEFWMKAGAVEKIVDEEKDITKYKMVRSSERRLARALCRRCKIQPSHQI